MMKRKAFFLLLFVVFSITSCQRLSEEKIEEINIEIVSRLQYDSCIELTMDEEKELGIGEKISAEEFVKFEVNKESEDKLYCCGMVFPKKLVEQGSLMEIAHYAKYYIVNDDVEFITAYVNWETEKNMHVRFLLRDDSRKKDKFVTISFNFSDWGDIPSHDTRED